jgi:5,10-methylenetetrahydromethanopterin reductase
MSPGAPLGLCLDGTLAIAEALRAARRAEAAGLESVWVSDFVGNRDPVATAAALLGATTRIRVVPMALSPYTRHPITIAMAAATLAEWRPGRVAIALGPGAPRALGSLGIRPERAAARLSETGEELRAWLSGGAPERMPPLRFQPPPVPIYLTATRPAMLGAAARFDGVVLSGGLSPEAVRWSLKHVDAGRRIEAVAMILLALDEAGRSAERIARETLAALLSAPHHQAVLEATEPHLDLGSVLDAVRAGDVALAGRLLPADLVSSHAVIGVEPLRERLAAYREAGIDLPVLWPIGDAREWTWLSGLV